MLKNYLNVEGSFGGQKPPIKAEVQNTDNLEKYNAKHKNRITKSRRFIEWMILYSYLQKLITVFVVCYLDKIRPMNTIKTERNIVCGDYCTDGQSPQKSVKKLTVTF